MSDTDVNLYNAADDWSYSSALEWQREAIYRCVHVAILARSHAREDPPTQRTRSPPSQITAYCSHARLGLLFYGSGQ
jgi:hypothetical protein